MAMAEARNRREFLGWISRRGLGLGLLRASAPATLAACGGDDDPALSGPATSLASPGQANDEARAIIGEVVDFALTSRDWEGDFGSVTLRLHKGVVDGRDVYFVRTDASDRGYADRERLVWVLKISGLAAPGLSGAAYLVESGAQGQATVLSSEPGRPDYTPAWTIHRVRWSGSPRLLSSVADVEAARAAGALSVERTNIVLNAALVKWSTGELPADSDRKAYLGPGQLLEPPDTSAMRVTFKLNQCFPGSRYFVTDHSMAPMAEMTNTSFAPALQEGPTRVGATGRTNVFMNGSAGRGPWAFSPRRSTSTPARRRGAPTGTTTPTAGATAARPGCSPARARCTGPVTPASWRSSPVRPTPTARCSP
jgi:hypothetical protein